MSNNGSSIQVKRQTNLPEPLRNASAVQWCVCYRSNRVYVLNSVYCLSIGGSRWKVKQPMPHGVCCPLVLQHRRYIYALRGFNTDRQSQSHVSQYNIHVQDDRWKRCRNMPVACGSTNAGVGVHDEELR